MIKGVTFDLWNTIFNNKFYSDFRLNYFTKFLKENKFKISLQKLNEAFSLKFYLAERNYEENIHVYTKDRLDSLLNSLSIDLIDEEKDLIVKEFEEVMLRDPPSLKNGIKETLEELSSNYEIGLISNTGITPGRIIDKVLQQYDIFKFFKVKIYSDEIGYYKPHPILFKTVLRKFKYQPQNVIHIGDKLETDIKGAKDCNMLAIWFNESPSSKSEFIIPDFEVHAISDVIKIIENFN